ncbi:MAG: radical SAM protein [Firmicutes bacterium]|nr:radical SAM protein [Bacillota bacterium]
MSLYEADCSPQVETKILGLNLTEQCNLNCSYCYQGARRDNRRNQMSFETATSAIDDHLSRDDEFKDVLIELIGGEVFLYWPLVRDVITWTLDRHSSWKKHFSFFIDTNGTLLNDEIKAWLFERRHHVVVGLSLDGTPEAHDLNRSDSYALIEPHIPFFARTWPHQTVKMTLHPSTLPMLFRNITHVMSLGLPVSANVPLEDIWGPLAEKAGHVKIFKQEIEKLVDFFSSNSQIPLPSIIDLPIAAVTSEEDHDRPWCGSGRNMVAIETNGRILPCNRYAAMSFDQTLFDHPPIPKAVPCDGCFFKAACQTCEAHNWEVNGHPDARTSFHCEFIKVQIWGTAQVQAVRLEKRVREIKSMPEEERLAHQDELALIRRQLVSVAAVLEHLENEAIVPGAAAF